MIKKRKTLIEGFQDVKSQDGYVLRVFSIAFTKESQNQKKKTKALSDMVTRLDLKSKVVNARVQDLLRKRRYTTLTARAVGPTSKLLRWVQPHWSQFERLLLIKGPRWIDERREAREKGLLEKVQLRVAAEYTTPPPGA